MISKCAFAQLQAYAEESIISNEQGMFLSVDGKWFRVEDAEITEDGTKVLVEGSWMSLNEALKCDSYWTWTCPICGTCRISR